MTRQVKRQQYVENSWHLMGRGSPLVAEATFLCFRKWSYRTVQDAIFSELGMRQFFSFVTTTTRQHNIASGTSQGPEKNIKIVRPQCLDGVATINIVKWNYKQFYGLITWSHCRDGIVACPALDLSDNETGSWSVWPGPTHRKSRLWLLYREFLNYIFPTAETKNFITSTCA